MVTDWMDAGSIPGETAARGSDGRRVPHSEDAEMAVLGACMIDPVNAIPVAEARLENEGSFYEPRHTKIFEAILELKRRGMESGVDFIAVTDYLRRNETLDRVGGEEYIRGLVFGVPSAANIVGYVEVVWQNAVLRQIIRKCEGVVQRCYTSSEDFRVLVGEVEKDVLGMVDLQSTEALPIGDNLIDAIGVLEGLRTGNAAVLGVQTGFQDLDQLIIGLRPGEMIVLGARASIGKTAFALNVISNVAIMADEPVPTGLFSLEMSRQEIQLRLLCSLARINRGDLRHGAVTRARWEALIEVGQKVRDAKLYVDDTGGLDILDLRNRARAMKKEFGVQLIVIDYLQLVRTSLGRNATRENQVGFISNNIKAMAKELGVPVLVLAQLNRQAEPSGNATVRAERPRLSHLRESGAIEQDADVVALLHRARVTRNEQNDQPMEAELLVAKHRSGPTGKVDMLFFPAYASFESRTRVDDEDVAGM